VKLGVMGSQFIREATKQRFYPSGRPVRDTTGRPVQFFTHHPQPRVDAEDPLGSLILLARDLDLDAVEFSLRSYLAPAELTRIGNLLAKHGVILATGYGDKVSRETDQKRADAIKLMRLGKADIPTTQKTIQDLQMQGALTDIKQNNWSC
jgi:hypothetical protein